MTWQPRPLTTEEIEEQATWPALIVPLWLAAEFEILYFTNAETFDFDAYCSEEVYP